MVEFNKILGIICSIVIVALIIIIGFKIFSLEFEEPRLTYNLCCDGEACTDTYYDNATNECVLALSGERYPAVNLTLI